MIINKEENRQNWIDRIKRQSESGLTQSKWCEENGINIHNFRYWKRIANSDNHDDSSGSFVAVKPVSCKNNSSIRLVIGCATIDVDDSVNMEFLNDVVKVLMHYA